MLRPCARALAAGLIALAGCASSPYVVRPLPRILADNVGQPVTRLQEEFGEPRKINATPTGLVYFWFVAETPAGAPVGLHGCEIEVAVDARSQRVLGVSLANVGWSKCGAIARRIRVAAN